MESTDISDCPTPDNLLEAIDAGDLHSMVIRGHSEVEKTLKIAISEALPEPHFLELEKLSFPLKVDLAIALRVLRPSSRATFLKINRIRNGFAHDSRAELTDQLAKDLCNVLSNDHKTSLKHQLAEANSPRNVLRIVLVIAFFEAMGAVERVRKHKQQRRDLSEKTSDFLSRVKNDFPHLFNEG